MSDLTFLHTFIKSELEDIVGSENVSIRSSDILVYGVDYFYGSKMWEDRGKNNQPHKPKGCRRRILS